VRTIHKGVELRTVCWFLSLTQTSVSEDTAFYLTTLS
jgi:hypothetical protein